MKQCENCRNVGCIPEVQRGVMDCDPAEWYCKADYDDIFYLDDTDSDAIEVIESFVGAEKVDEEFINNFVCPGFKVRYDD